MRERQVLLKAWRVIRSNAEKSGSKETRKAVEAFDRNLLGHIQNIQRRLKDKRYVFDKAVGVTPPKGKNKPGKRAIVIATVRDRIVQRAILDTIYEHCHVPIVQDVIRTKTSVGGVPGRGIGDALALIETAVSAGAKYAVRSDIKDFFPSFPRAEVITFLKAHIDDSDFVDLFERAVTVELSNHDALGSDVELFPIGEDGVAQGSPLSVLAGNIVLRKFDRVLNGRGVTCVRYIDDFIVLGPDERSTKKALLNGISVLAKLGLQAYTPEDGSGKSSAGPSDQPYDFLGYRVVGGLNPPSPSSCQKLLEKIDAEIREGKKWIGRRVATDTPDVKYRQCYMQTLVQIDNILRGWAGAFQYTRSTQALRALDAKIDQRLAEFDAWFGGKTHSAPTHIQRRAFGIRLLGDGTPTPLPTVIGS